MTQAASQIILTLIFLGAALAFELLGETQISVALVGAVLGQGTAVAVQSAVNGKNKEA